MRTLDLKPLHILLNDAKFGQIAISTARLEEPHESQREKWLKARQQQADDYVVPTFCVGVRSCCPHKVNTLKNSCTIIFFTF